VVSFGGSAALGLAYWSIAAHQHRQVDVGKSAAMIAAMILIAAISQLGYGALFQRQLPLAGRHSARLIVRAYVVSTTVGVLLSTLYVWSGLARHFLPSGSHWGLIFVVSTGLWTIFALQDNALVALRASRWVPVENILYSLAKLALLPLALWGTSASGLFLTWMAPIPLALIGVNWFLFRVHLPRRMKEELPTEEMEKGRSLWSMTAAQAVTTMLSNVSGSIVTLIVLAHLGGAANSIYYVSFQIVLGPMMFLWSVSRSLLVEALHEPERMNRHTRRGLATTLVILLGTWIVAVPLAPWVMLIFGHSYVSSGTTLLRLQLLALPGTAVTAFYTAYAWIDKKLWSLTARALISLVVNISVLELLIDRFRLAAVGLAAIATAVIEVTLFLPMTWRRVRQELRPTTR
jgi:O-antigen/teichoic acid export membrane protein